MNLFESYNAVCNYIKTQFEDNKIEFLVNPYLTSDGMFFDVEVYVNNEKGTWEELWELNVSCNNIKGIFLKLFKAINVTDDIDISEVIYTCYNDEKLMNMYDELIKLHQIGDVYIDYYLTFEVDENNNLMMFLNNSINSETIEVRCVSLQDGIQKLHEKVFAE